MKKQFKFLAQIALSVALVSSFASCEKNNGTEEPTPEVLDLGDGSDAYEITSDLTLSYPNTYNLKGWVYVTDGATLTIEPGVIIKGEKESKATLVIEKGAKIMAEGTAERPIVFTSAQEPGSRNPGDWGGLVILGEAENNSGDMTIEGGIRSTHGGSSNGDNSGILSYVRVEFAGIEYATDNEINGITLGSVGNGTQIDHVQVSYSGDDAFEFFGGSVNCTHLITLGTWDDDFDTDNGYSGNLQFLFAVRDGEYADKSASNGFESDNNSSASAVSPFTSAVFSNVTIVGPVADPTDYTDMGSVHGSSTGFFQNAVQIRRNSRMNLFNSVIMGFPIGLNVDNDKSSSTQEAHLDGSSFVANNIMAGMIRNFQDAATNKQDPVDYTASDEVMQQIWSAGNNETPLSTISDLALKGDPQSLTAPNAIPSTSSIAASGAEWTNSLISGSFFEKTTYRGAFSSSETSDDNWTTGWANFDPQNTVY
ncbi:MAG: hypothetical protein R3Y19_06215 [Rikenellaceae bacterium]